MFKDPSDDVSAPVENSTTTVLDNLELPLNYRNEQLCEFVEDNPLENVVLDEPLLAINDFKNQLKQISNTRKLERFETVLPTCAERDEKGELVTIWRVIPKIIPGSGGDLFNEGKKSFIVKGDKIVLVMLNLYNPPGPLKLLTKLPVSMLEGSRGMNIVGSDTLNRIMHFEKSPSSQKGKLIEAWKELAAFDNFL
jgi:hypothetical protein